MERLRNCTQRESHKSRLLNHQAGATCVKRNECANDRERASRFVNPHTRHSMLRRNKLRDGQEQESECEEEEDTDDGPVGLERGNQENEGQEAP